MNENQSHSDDDNYFDDAPPQDEVDASTDQAHRSFDALESRDEGMTRMRREVNAAEKRVLQAQADAENFRKRMRRDYEDQLKFAAMPLIGDILHVRDNLQRAIDAAGASGGDSTAGLRDGVVMVVKQLDDTLAKHGVESIPAEGEEFDPNYHEAISQMPHSEIESGKVAHVAGGGFRMHGRVIRPAQVVVSTGNP